MNENQTATKPKRTKLAAKPPEEIQPGKTKMLIYGASGVGKTWFTITFPNPYYIDTEGGADLRHYQERLKVAGGAYLGPPDGALDFDFILEQIQALATEKHGYKTLIIDSVTKLYQSAIAEENERLLRAGQKDEFGMSKKPAVRYMRRLVNWCNRLDMNVLFVAHETAEWASVNGARQEVGKISDVWDKLIYELDLTLQAVKRGNSRVAIVRKSRLTGFEDANEFPLEYGDFATRYGKDFIEAAPKQIVLATGEQVAKIKELLEVVKVTEAEVEKVKNKAGADDWSELTTEQADATIKWLQNKIK